MQVEDFYPLLVDFDFDYFIDYLTNVKKELTEIGWEDLYVVLTDDYAGDNFLAIQGNRPETEQLPPELMLSKTPVKQGSVLLYFSFTAPI